MDYPLSATDETTSSSNDEILCLLDYAAFLFWAKKYKVACYTLSRALDINKEMLVSEMMRAEDDDYHHHSQRSTISNDQSGLHVHARSSPSSSSATPPSFSCLELLSFVIARSSKRTIDEAASSLSAYPLENDKMGGIFSWQVDTHRNIYACATLMLVKPCKELFELFENIPTRDTHLTLSLIIIFNMALSQHFHALDQIKEGCSLSTRYHLLNRAFLLYNHAEALLHQLQLQSCWFLSLVILNNEAQLLFMMGKPQEASSLLQVILSYLCYVNLVNQEGEGEVENIIPVVALETFVHNTSHMILKEVIVAAAA